MFYNIIKLCACIAYFMINFSCVLSKECGREIYDSRLGRIVGGQKVGYYKYPWFAILELSNSNIFTRQVQCGGSLITPQHVVTAAHCFEQQDPDDYASLYDVVLGVYNNCKNEKTRTVYKVKSVLVHEEYGPQNPWHDIALITLQMKSENEVVCLPTGPELPSGAMVTGFGVEKSGAYTEPCEQRQVDVKIYNQANCTTMLQYQEQSDNLEFTFPFGAFCAGYLEGGKDSCQGDSGGPITFSPNTGTTLIGLVSFGYGCASRNALGVYTSIYDYLDWLVSNTDGYIDTPTDLPPTTADPTTTKRPKKHKKPHRHPHRPKRPNRYSVWDTVNYYENLKKINPQKHNRKSRKV